MKKYWIYCVVGIVLVILSIRLGEVIMQEKVQEIGPVSAEELSLAYEEDRAAANAKYRGKVFVVSGNFGEVGKYPIDGKPNIWLRGEHTPICYIFEKGNSIIQVEKGKQVQIKGRCNGLVAFGFVIEFEDCKIH